MKATTLAVLSGIATALVITMGAALVHLSVENQKLVARIQAFETERAEMAAKAKAELPEIHRRTCLNGLRMLDNAVQQWALEENKRNDDLPVPTDLIKYLPGGYPKCPAGGDYRLSMVGGKPRCSIATHQLP